MLLVQGTVRMITLFSIFWQVLHDFRPKYEVLFLRLLLSVDNRIEEATSRKDSFGSSPSVPYF